VVTVKSGFRFSDLSITGPTRLPTALTGPTGCEEIEREKERVARNLTKEKVQEQDAKRARSHSALHRTPGT
jgi:hypothetical protein